MKTIRNLFLLITLIGFTLPIEARWANVEDLDVILELMNKDIQVFRDGTYVETTTISYKATKESGKDRLVSVPISYNAMNSTLKILEAKTINQGIEYPVDLAHIEDKPLASSPQGFDQQNQILIAFPHISIGASIYLKIQKTITKPAIPGFYASNLIYGMGEYWGKSHIHISSELPLFLKAHDKASYLDIKQSQVKDQYLVDVELKKPVFKLPIEEVSMAFNANDYPWVTLSTVDQWSTLGNMLEKQYEPILQAALPSLFEDIANAAKTQATSIGKINFITSQLAENITYMGDWRTVAGAYVPRKLEEIASSKIGDCKDFSAVTVAILRKLGIQADVAIIYRGLDLKEPPTDDLPNMNVFNHMMVRAQDKQNIIWVDPTNFYSFAQGIYPDIADRSTLVIDPKGAYLSKTAPINPKDSGIAITEKIFLPKEPEVVNVEGELKVTGIQALSLTGADLKASKEIIDLDIIRSVADESRAIKWQVGPYDLKSRIVRDLNFNFKLTQKHTLMKTSAGKSFLLSTRAFLTSKILAKTTDRVTDLYFETPSTFRYEILLPKVSLVGKEFASCKVESPWLNATRNIKDTSGGIQIVDELVVSKDKISNAELKSDAYAKFQDQIHACFGETALVYHHQ